VEEIRFDESGDTSIVVQADNAAAEPTWSRPVRAGVVLAVVLITAVMVVGIVFDDRPDEGPTEEIAEPTRQVESPAPTSRVRAPDVMRREMRAGPPLRPVRSAVTFKGNDRGIVVFGGISHDGGATQQFSDGAFFNFATSAWTKMSTSPFVDDDPWASTAAIWVGDELVIYRGRAGAAWDRTSDSWRDLAKPDRTVNTLVAVRSTGEPERLLGLGTNAMYDVATNRWTPFSGIALVGPDPLNPTAEVVVDTPNELLVVSAWGEIRTVAGAGPLVNTGTWDGGMVGAAWTGSDVMIVTDDRDAVRFDVETGAIRRLPSVPVDFGEGPITIDVGSDGRIIVNEQAVYEDCCGWFVRPYPVPRTSLSGFERHDDAIWRLGVEDGGDGTDRWSFTRLDDRWFDDRSVLAVGAATIELDDSVELMGLTVSALPAVGASALVEYIVAQVEVTDRLIDRRHRCDVIYHRSDQPKPALAAATGAGVIGYNAIGGDGGVAVGCPSEAAIQEVLGALNW